jgi:xanthine dehydrogenase molybdopterin-binding subunit B
METKTLISRRDLLKSTGVLVVGFSFFGTAAKVLAQGEGLSVDGMDPTVLDSWLAISKDGTVTVYTGKVELGTGVVTALAQIVAEELDVPFNKVDMYSGDTDKAVDQGVTAAARTVERGGVQLRQASAAARQELLKLASAKLDTPADMLTVTDGVISVVGNPGKKIAYGDLLGGQKFNIKIVAAGVGWDMKVAPNITPKNYKDYKIVGKSIPRVDLPGKFTGEFVYSQDASAPGMLHGRVVRPATSLSAPVSIDEASIKNIPGVVKVVHEGNFVGVVAETEWAAVQAARTLKITWSEPTLKMMSGPQEVFDYLMNTKSFRDTMVVNRGNLDAGFAKAQKKYEATYYWPFQLHGMMGRKTGLRSGQERKARSARAMPSPNCSTSRRRASTCSIAKAPAAMGAWRAMTSPRTPR